MELLFSISMNYISDIFSFIQTYRLVERNHSICIHSVLMTYLQLKYGHLNM